MTFEICDGKVVPDRIDESRGSNCANSYCHTVRCEDCIYFEGVLTRSVGIEYVQRGAERVPNDRDKTTSEDMD